MPSSKLVLGLWVLLVVATGSLIGYATRPDAWFEALAKPFFQPPAWLFAPVWTILYILIAIAGWRVASVRKDRQLTRLWGLQMLLNYLWSPAFFALHNIGLALGIIVALLVVLIAFVHKARKSDPISAWLFAPYLAWVSFATLLNAAILRLN